MLENVGKCAVMGSGGVESGRAVLSLNDLCSTLKESL